MTVIELMAELSAFDENLRVFVYADHGQQAEESYTVSEYLLDSDNEICTRQDLEDDEWDEEEIDKLERVIVI